VAFDYDSSDRALPHQEQFFEFLLVGVRFLQGASTYAVRLYGSREGSLRECYFENNKGVYRERAINTDIVGCHWKNTAFGVDDRTGSEGLKLIGGTMLGVRVGLSLGATFGTQIVGAMIDYCDRPIICDGTQNMEIAASYVSSRTAYPCVQIQRTGPSTPKHIRISGGIFRQNSSEKSSCVLRFQDADFVTVQGANLGNYRKNGLEYTRCTNLEILNNRIWSNPAGAGVFSIEAGVGPLNCENSRQRS
jgi:hypothetical protein